MSCVHLASALVKRDDRLLLVASRYPNHAKALWNLPGGRQTPGELLRETVMRELREETGLSGSLGDLCYVSESYDGETHFTSFVFAVTVENAPETFAQPSGDEAARDHIEAVEWVRTSDLAGRIAVRVVREPLLAYLAGSSTTRYTGYAEAGISIVFPD